MLEYGLFLEILKLSAYCFKFKHMEKKLIFFIFFNACFLSFVSKVLIYSLNSIFKEDLISMLKPSLIHVFEL